MKRSLATSIIFVGLLAVGVGGVQVDKGIHMPRSRKLQASSTADVISTPGSAIATTTSTSTTAATPGATSKISPVAASAAASGSTKYSFGAQPSWSQNYAAMADGVLSPSVWNFAAGNNDGWGNNEVEDYTSDPSNVRVAGGNLVIEAQKTSTGYTSARIDTGGKFDFTYGKIAITAKLPTGAGIWPAFWIWPSGDKYPVADVPNNYPDTNWLSNGEIDILEGSAQGDTTFSSSAHSVAHSPGQNERTGGFDIGNPSTAYHTYALSWTPDSLVFSVDNKAYYTVTNPHTSYLDWPYDQPFHVILNIALGGTQSQNLIGDFPPDGVDSSKAPWQMQVSAIDYYPLVTN